MHIPSPPTLALAIRASRLMIANPLPGAASEILYVRMPNTDHVYIDFWLEGQSVLATVYGPGGYRSNTLWEYYLLDAMGNRHSTLGVPWPPAARSGYERYDLIVPALAIYGGFRIRHSTRDIELSGSWVTERPQRFY